MSVKKSSDSQLVVYTLGSTVILLIGAFWTRMGHFEKWHKGGCDAPRFLIHYICSWEISMFDELWSEIQDAPGEIFDMDIPELREDNKFDVNEYLNANYDYWCLSS